MAFMPELVMWILAVFSFPFVTPKFFAPRTISAIKPPTLPTNTNNITSDPLVWEHLPGLPSLTVEPPAAVNQHNQYALTVITPKSYHGNGDRDLLTAVLFVLFLALSITMMCASCKKRRHSRSRARKHDTLALSIYQTYDSLPTHFLQAQLNEAQSLLNDHKALLNKEKDTSNKHFTTTRDLQTQNATLQQKVEALQEKNLTANDHCEQQQSTITELRAAAFFAQAEMQHDQDDTETLRCRLQTLQSQLDTTENRTSNQDSQVRTLTARCRELEDVVRIKGVEVQAKNAELQAKNAELKAKNAEVVEKEESIFLGFGEILNLQVANGESATELAKLTDDYNELNELFTELDQNHEALKEQHTELDQEHKDLDQTCTNAFEHIKQLEIQLTRLKDEHKNLSQQHRETKFELMVAQDTIAMTHNPKDNGDVISMPNSAPEPAERADDATLARRPMAKLKKSKVPAKTG